MGKTKRRRSKSKNIQRVLSPSQYQHNVASNRYKSPPSKPDGKKSNFTTNRSSNRKLKFHKIPSLSQSSTIYQTPNHTKPSNTNALNFTSAQYTVIPIHEDNEDDEKKDREDSAPTDEDTEPDLYSKARDSCDFIEMAAIIHGTHNCNDAQTALKANPSNSESHSHSRSTSDANEVTEEKQDEIFVDQTSNGNIGESELEIEIKKRPSLDLAQARSATITNTKLSRPLTPQTPIYGAQTPKTPQTYTFNFAIAEHDDDEDDVNSDLEPMQFKRTNRVHGHGIKSRRSRLITDSLTSEISVASSLYSQDEDGRSCRSGYENDIDHDHELEDDEIRIISQITPQWTKSKSLRADYNEYLQLDYQRKMKMKMKMKVKVKDQLDHIY